MVSSTRGSIFFPRLSNSRLHFFTCRDSKALYCYICAPRPASLPAVQATPPTTIESTPKHFWNFISLCASIFPSRLGAPFLARSGGPHRRPFEALLHWFSPRL